MHDTPRSWSESLKSFTNPKVLALLFLGFSAGLPILLIFSSLSIWLREAGVERSAVTFFSWAALGYSFKFVWAPIVDRVPIPLLTRWLGRRRGWLLLSQMAIIAALLFMASNNPQDGLVWVAMGAVMLGFSSATQDIVIDAYRIEAADESLQAMMSSAYIAGYRVGMVAAGAGALALASWFGSSSDAYSYTAWASAYHCMAAAMAIGVLTTIIINEPTGSQRAHHYATGDYLRFLLLFVLSVAGFALTFSMFDGLSLAPILGDFVAGTLRFVLSLTAAVVVATVLVKIHFAPQQMVHDTYLSPFLDFFQRYQGAAVALLIMISTYRIADIIMGTVANVFYTDMGYSKAQIATITKTFGLLMTIAGGFLGGVLALRFGVMRMLKWGAYLAAATNLLFAWLAVLEPITLNLALVIAADNLSAGIASSAFIAFLSGLTSRSFTAMQYAIFSSLMTLLPKLLAGYSGTLVDALDYPLFFISSALLGLPVIAVVWWVERKMRALDAR